jgi:exopolysaccharide/PEP-CTERM locus tyrosine autokinase
LPAEGKTFCAINLARSMALEIDTSVILVDADVLRPSVLDRLGLSGSRPGLLDVLTQPDVDFDDVLLKTNIPKLSILPAGSSNASSSELLASEAMDRMLERLSEEYASSIVVFDAPPLLATMEAKVLASHVGQIILVVEASRTPRRAVERALGFIERCPSVMTVLNKAEEPVDRQDYADYYG